MKIAADVRMANASGIGTYIRNVIPGVISRFPEIEFCLLGGPEAIAVLDTCRRKNVQFIELNSNIYSIREQIDLLQKTPRDCDAFWALHYNIPLFFRGTMISTIYDAFHLANPQFVGGLHKRLYAKLMFKAVARKSDKVLSISTFTEQELARLTSIDPTKIETIHLGVHSSWFDIPERPRPQENPYFIFVGNVKPHKNLVSLIEAFCLVKDQIPHNLVIVGKREGFITGDQRVALAAEQCRGRVTFTDFISDDLLKQYIKHAEAMIFPSLYEGFGLPPLEAMACGCPVAISTAASLPEVCGDAALYFEPLNLDEIACKMKELAADGKIREKYRTRGIVRARMFRWDDCIAKTARSIDETLSKIP